MLKSFFDKTKYEAGIFLFLITQVALYIPTSENMPVWQILTYLNDYSKGYMPRAFLGEVITWFSPTVSLELLWWLSLTVCILLCLAIALVGGYLIKKAENKTAVIGIIGIIIASPIFIPVMSAWLGVTDIYLILLTIIAFVLNENKFLRYLIPLISLVCIAIHHTYVLIYMVPIAIALLYDCFKNKKYVRDGIFCGITYLALIIFTLFTLNARKATAYDSVDSMIDYMLVKADFPLSVEWLKTIVPNEYSTGLDYLLGTITSTMSPLNLLGIIVIFAPIFVLFAYGWIKAIRHAEEKCDKFIFFLCLIQPVPTIPAYILGLNWNRWTSAIITSQCILYLFMLYRKNSTVASVVNKVTDFLQKHFIAVILYFIYYASFAKLLG